MLSIESLALARYAEVTGDGLLNVMGAGWNGLRVQDEERAGTARFYVAASVLCVDRADDEFDIVCTLLDPEGEAAARITATVRAAWEEDHSVRRIPLAFEMAGEVTRAGQWRVELSTGEDLRVVTFDAIE